MEDEAARASPGRRRRVASPAPVVRLAQLVRTPTPAPKNSGGLIDGTVVIEVGNARVTVTRGADLQSLVLVLALLRGTGR